MPRSSPRRRPSAALSAGIVLTIGLSGMAAALAATAAAEPPGSALVDTNINGYRTIGYFTQWGAEEGFTAKRLQDTGSAAQLTHLNYAFGNIHPDDLTCFEANQPGGEPNSPTAGDYAGDAEADYQRLYTAEESVSGVADAPDQALAGSFNQIKQLKALNPDLKVMISLGGWTWSKFFSDAAATPESREKFVSSCVSLYIRGDLPVLDDAPQGGAGAGAGVFDGIDIDWEWPGATDSWAYHPGNHVDIENDKANMTALLAEFRRQLDEAGAADGKSYLLSAFLPANPKRVSDGWDVPGIFGSLDFANVQGYDLFGSWDTDNAGHQVPLFLDPKAPGSAPFSGAGIVEGYIEAGVDPAQLTLGMATYGQGWAGVAPGENGENGLWQTPTGPLWSTADGNNYYSSIKKAGPIFYDPVAGASWMYNAQTGDFWSIDDPRSVARKAQYIAEAGLGGGMWWDLSGDDGDELTSTLASGLAAAERGPITSPPTPAPTPTTDPTVTPTPTTDPTSEPSPSTDPGTTPTTGAPAPAPSMSLGATTVVAGGTVTISASGFVPQENVEAVLHSTPVRLGSALADTSGGVTLTVAIPSTTAAGEHTIVLTGASGRTVSQTIVVTAAAGAAGKGRLSETGADVTAVVVAAGALLLAGGGALALRRRRI